ncbi:hypothetical protein [Teichococcus deserti]|uniref:hypothetical protein n=1 Tax=Teichococcus deserti TaxID=1817963 RepID=UPI0013F59B58|nr:hypothetical protein [Pseudoroseomonas deserti]
MLLIVLNVKNDCTDVITSTEPEMVTPEEYSLLQECVAQCNEEAGDLLTFELVVVMDF